MASWFRKRETVPSVTVADDSSSARSGIVSRVLGAPVLLRWLIAVVAALIVWYGVIGTLRAGISPDLLLRPTAEALPPGGSVTVGMAARLIEAEALERAFTPNDPAIFPTGLARRTPAYQAQLVRTVQETVEALAAHDSGDALRDAAEQLNVPPEQGWLRAGWPPVRLPAERHYARAVQALVQHNQALAASGRRAEGREVALDAGSRAALQAIADAVEAEAATGDRMIRGTDEGSVAVRLAAQRGTAFAAAILMRGLRDDNAGAIRLSGRAARWGEALDALDRAAMQNPMFAGNSDLVANGYALLMAGSAIRAILDAPA